MYQLIKSRFYKLNYKSTKTLVIAPSVRSFLLLLVFVFSVRLFYFTHYNEFLKAILTTQICVFLYICLFAGTHKYLNNSKLHAPKTSFYKLKTSFYKLKTSFYKLKTSFYKSLNEFL